MVKAIESKQEFDELLASGVPFVADFWATWCGPCKMISPHFGKLEEKFPQVKFVKVDVDEQTEISETVGVRAMPTFVAFHQGQKFKDVIGAKPANLTTLVEELAAKLS